MSVAYSQQSAHELPFSRNWALFLDIDGTILDLAETPGQVVVTGHLRELVRSLSAAAGGAFALVSGRSLSDIDALFRIPGLCAAGLHGVECRTSHDGVTHVQSVDESVMQSFRGRLRAYVERYPGLVLEDKKLSIAIHFRRAANLQADVERILSETIAGHEAFHIQRGKMIAEIKSRDSNKGFAVRRFMQTPPFHGRIPVFIGDDITDEDGFCAANELGGISIKVGFAGHSSAGYCLGQPADVLDWLETYLKFLST
jgi:trehalose 6-phosphate phosphatase